MAKVTLFLAGDEESVCWLDEVVGRLPDDLEIDIFYRDYDERAVLDTSPAAWRIDAQTGCKYVERQVASTIVRALED